MYVYRGLCVRTINHAAYMFMHVGTGSVFGAKLGCFGCSTEELEGFLRRGHVSVASVPIQLHPK